ncbi:16S rRNA (guanine(966)-N(2))-methyltransferase RsmD [Anaerosphaera multitolerans]|uniref:16S rRNA (Guanine(966)-N(2))-methyltransferase RsmD n=1 Tax=Anaerosphaera multitolerans TaxID=2487351 RepID=A0A437S7S2_9FIRM|nr:16S rRNA (guanine(966)-N(2))-methyltransferase RsmD [Anaerosphaera multitolerans]RVU54897.1 16S rRNA (guanine(966)-N(2))-methyltransferase RsmD [Anaerosphaera multitolerans]
MRVISGINRGIKLETLKGNSTRPTEDRIKENVFNILGQNFFDTYVLDLFSGSGSIGIEFLSRGAAHCYFIDNNVKAIDIIRRNLEKTNLSQKSTVLKIDALVFLKKYNNIKFDYIYVDPPYENKTLYMEVVKSILKNESLKREGFLIIEQNSNFDLDFNDSLEMVKYKKYGNTSIGVWKIK